MPSYDYECLTCHDRFRVQETVGEHAKQNPQACPKCGSGQVRELIVRVRAQTRRTS
jgi:putative FmdB family regulatory protein